MKFNRGFTLVELLVVISVIAILLGIIIPRFKGMQEEANRSKAKSELKTLQVAVESWYMHQSPQAYPPTTSTLCATYLDTASPLMVSSPLYDPFAAPGTEYNYAVSSNGAYYIIWSVGPTGGTGIAGIGTNGVIIGNTVSTDVFVTNGVQQS